MDHDCHSLTELQERISSGNDLADLGDCPRCQALARLLRGRESLPSVDLDFADSAEPLQSEPHIPERGGAETLEPGSVVSVIDPAAGSGTFLLGAVTVARDSSLELVPLTTQVDMAAEWDLLLAADEGCLGYATAIEVWNHGTVALEQVDENLGKIAASKLDALLDLWGAVFVEDSPPAHATVGPPLLDEADPRLLFQAAEVERVQRFWQLDEPAVRSEVEVAYELEPRVPLRVAASAASSVGVIAREWMEREGWGVEDLAREAGYHEYQLEPILEDRIDPCASAYRHDKLGRFLDVIEFDDDEDALLASVDANVFPTEIKKEERSLAFNRDGLGGRLRRRSRNEAQREELTDAQIEQARAYVREVLAFLEELRAS